MPAPRAPVSFGKETISKSANLPVPLKKDPTMKKPSDTSQQCAALSKRVQDRYNLSVLGVLFRELGLPTVPQNQ